MPSGRQLERLRLFRLYSKNLAIHMPELAGLFICPICLNGFRESDVFHGLGLKVNLGHIFPKEIGGTQVVLECCECNGRLNRAGDNELVKLHKQWDAMRPDRDGAPIRAHFLMPAGRVGVDVTSDRMHTHWKMAEPQAMNEVVQALLDGSPIQIEMPSVCRKKIDVATLHSAYLLFFREFGYGYVKTPGGWHVREQLMNAENLPDDAFLSVEMSKSESSDPTIIFRIGVCHLPGGEKCLYAALPVADPNALCQYVLLPGPWDKDASAYKRLSRHSGTWIHQMRCETVDRRVWQHLAAPEYRNALALAWSGWMPHNIDMTKLMGAIRSEANDSDTRRIDASNIGERLGFGRALPHYIQSLAERGFLLRTPKRQRLHLVRLTAKSLAVPLLDE